MVTGASLLLASALSYRELYPLPSADGAWGWGANIHFTRAKDGELEKLKEMGLGWIRMDLHWNAVEREKGVYDFTEYDVLLGDLRKHGIRPVMILCYGNSLHEEGAPKREESQAAFAKFAVTAVKRYRGRGVLWEMWNEPNLGMFWQPSANPSQYIRLATLVGQGIRREAPEEWYVGPATSGFDWEFLKSCFEGGLLRLFDAVTVHPYRQTMPETAGEDWRRLRAMVARFSPSSPKPLLSGEWGYSDVWKGFGRQKQAKFVVRQALSSLENGVGLSIYYDWKDDGVDPKEPEHHFGLWGSQLEDKPSGLAASFFAQRLAGWTLGSSQSLGAGSLLLFRKGKEVKGVAWAREALSLPVTKHPLSRTALVVEGLAGRSDLAAGAGLPLGEMPVILIPKARTPWLGSLASMPMGERWVSGGPRELVLKEADAFVEKAMAAAQGNRAWLWVGRRGGMGQWEPDLALPFPKTKDQGRKAALQAARRVQDAGEETALLLTVVSPKGESAKSQLIFTPRWPLSVEVGARPGSWILRNPEGWLGTGGWKEGARSGTFEATGAETQSLPVTGEKVTFNLGGRRLPSAWGETVLPLPTEGSGFAAVVEGDAPGKAEVRLNPEAAGEWVYDSEFPDGWSYSLINPAQPLPLPPRAKEYGVEVFGDGSGNILRSRFVDGSGQVFQPEGMRINWQGWRLVRFAVSEKGAGFWGGAGDGVMKRPVRIESLLLVDSADRKAGKTRLRFRLPHAVLGPVLTQR